MPYPSIRVAIQLIITAVLGVNCAEAQQDAPPPARRFAIPAAGLSNELPQILRLNASAVITSPLIRLRDIAQPVEPISPWWDRTGGVVVAIMPLDGEEMVIELSRLTEALASDSSVPEVQWTGPERVRVRMVRGEPSDSAATSDSLSAGQHHDSGIARGEPQSAEISPVGFALSAGSDAAVATVPGASGPAGATVQGSADSEARLQNAQRAVASVANLPTLSFQESDRLVHLIQYAIDRNDLSIRESYDIEIDPNQLSLRALAELRRVDRTEFIRPPAEGPVEIIVHGASSRQEISAPVQLQLIARPLVVVPRDSLRRGHVISSSDVMLQPAPRGVAINSVFTNIDDVIDMQVQNVLQKDRPITISSITRPVLIERGDLVEVQVVGGGITVATSARSLARGAAGDLIAVETLEPRKKVMARVARAGLVEIATRPPRVR